jgi:hypothetical protein
MSRALAMTEHAVVRYVERWRPGLSFEDARAELQSLADRAAPTRHRTVKQDARIYLGESPAGEPVPLAVRDRTVVTVLPRQDDPLVVGLPDWDLRDDGADDRAAGRAMVRESELEAAIAARPPIAIEPAMAAPEVQELAQRSRRLNAEKVVREWRLGVPVKRRALRRACGLLGIPVPSPRESAAGTLSIAGGRWDGLRVEIREGDALTDIVGRLLAAMRARA